MGAGTIRRDLSVFEAEDVEFEQRIYEEDGTTLRDLTGYTITYYVYDSGETYLTDAASVTETSTGVLTGDVDISSLIPDPGPGEYLHLLQIESGGNVEVIFTGRLEIQQHPA